MKYIYEIEIDHEPSGTVQAEPAAEALSEADLLVWQRTWPQAWPVELTVTNFQRRAGKNLRVFLFRTGTMTIYRTVTCVDKDARDE